MQEICCYRRISFSSLRLYLPDARLRACCGSNWAPQFLRWYAGTSSFSFSSSGRRIWKDLLPLAFSNRSCARWIAFLLHLLIIVIWQIHRPAGSLTLVQLISFGLFIFFFFFLEKIMNQFFSWSFFDFLFLNFKWESFSFGVFLLQELKLALDSLLLERKINEVESSSIASFFTILPFCLKSKLIKVFSNLRLVTGALVLEVWKSVVRLSCPLELSFLGSFLQNDQFQNLWRSLLPRIALSQESGIEYPDRRSLQHCLQLFLLYSVISLTRLRPILVLLPRHDGKEDFLSATNIYIVSTKEMKSLHPLHGWHVPRPRSVERSHYGKLPAFFSITVLTSFESHRLHLGGWYDLCRWNERP